MKESLQILRKLESERVELCDNEIAGANCENRAGWRLGYKGKVKVCRVCVEKREFKKFRTKTRIWQKED